ncbi:hypothetical protein B0H12DRAFT_1117031, partial [Mycena haematopus]
LWSPARFTIPARTPGNAKCDAKCDVTVTSHSTLHGATSSMRGIACLFLPRRGISDAMRPPEYFRILQ